MCDHLASGRLHYDMIHECLVYELVCDICQMTLGSEQGDDYHPDPKLDIVVHGNVAQPGRALP